MFAIIRQLGNPTWFCHIFGKLVEKKDLTDDEINNMTWKQKLDRIQKDPVTYARNFEHIMQLFIKDVFKSNVMPIGEILDFFLQG